MSIASGGLHHLAIRVTDLSRARAFYCDTLGFEKVLETEGLVLVNAHGTLIGIRGGAPETASGDRFNPFRVGLDHLALTATSSATLDTLRADLDAAGVPNNGIEDDAITGARHITFYDPDGIAWELYAMPAQ